MKAKKKPGRPSQNMFNFFSSIDWVAYWEEWLTKVRPDGKPYYRSPLQFAVAKGKNQPEKDFIVWFLGAKGDEDHNHRYPFTTPQDWLKKRETGGWYTDDQLKQVSREFAAKENALEALREAGNKYILRFFPRLERLAQKLDEAFLGELVLPNNSWAENLARIRQYFGFYQDLLGMSERAQEMYAKAHGVSLENMESFAQLLTISATLHQQTGDQSQRRLNHAMQEIAAMALMKSHKYGTPIPDDVKDKLIEASFTKEEDKGKAN